MVVWGVPAKDAAAPVSRAIAKIPSARFMETSQFQRFKVGARLLLVTRSTGDTFLRTGAPAV